MTNQSKLKVVDRAVAAPRHLEAAGRKLWGIVVGEYELTGAAKAVLLQGCESLDRLRQVQETIKRDGIVGYDRFGQSRPHPLLKTEQDARLSVLRSLRLLNLDFDDYEN